jgi:hypothetical protein
MATPAEKDAPEQPSSEAAPPEAPAAESTPESTPEPAPASPDQAPGVAATISVPPLEGSPESGEGGGEWDLLTSKVQAWLNSGQLQEFWQSARTPLLALLAVVAVVLVLRVYAALLGALDGLPLVPGLLELVGVIWILRHGLPKLLRSSEREQLIEQLQRRWKAFLGKS